MIQKEGGIHSIIAAMKAHPQVVAVQDTACAALWNLGTKGCKLLFAFLFVFSFCFVCLSLCFVHSRAAKCHRARRSHSADPCRNEAPSNRAAAAGIRMWCAEKLGCVR